MQKQIVTQIVLIREEYSEICEEPISSLSRKSNKKAYPKETGKKKKQQQWNGTKLLSSQNNDYASKIYKMKSVHWSYKHNLLLGRFAK